MWTTLYFKAMKEKNPHLMTLATLTGHCVLTYGYFSAIMVIFIINYSRFCLAIISCIVPCLRFLFLFTYLFSRLILLVLGWRSLKAMSNSQLFDSSHTDYVHFLFWTGMSKLPILFDNNIARFKPEWWFSSIYKWSVPFKRLVMKLFSG